MSSIPDQGAGIVVTDPRPSDYIPLLLAEQGRLTTFHFFPRGEDAFRRGPLGGFDLWIINLHLPDTSGLELCRLLRERLAQVPVLLIGNRYDSADEMAVLSAGGVYYAFKPVTASWLRRASDPSGGQRSLAAIQEDCPASDSPGASLASFNGNKSRLQGWHVARDPQGEKK